ncbi:MAG: thiamine pyrophosphate-dependent enzyme [Actinomycetota bacterium]
MPIKHVLLDNGSLGKIGKEQRAGQFPRWQVSLTNPNFADYAVLCGAAGETVRRGGRARGGRTAHVCCDRPLPPARRAGRRARPRCTWQPDRPRPAVDREHSAGSTKTQRRGWTKSNRSPLSQPVRELP